MDIKLPTSLVGGFGLPAHVLTQERATYLRNAPCAKPVLLANMGDDEKQSLQEVSAIGAPNLQADAELWVHVAGGALTITEDKRKWWVQSLRRLHDLRLASLDRFADYVLRTRPLIQDGGLLVCDALDAFVASETTRDFMARLRIGIMADQAPPPDPRDGCPEDIVFSQDVIARHARPEWYPVTAVPVDPALLNPAQQSRRRPASTGDMKSVTCLCCPAQRAEGWAYLTAVATFIRGDWDGERTRCLVPARQLDFQDPKTSQIFEETHNLGTWVVNYDELLDRRQLLEQQVRIIRYKQVGTQGRNLIISSRAPVGLLQSMVVSRLRDLHLGLDDGNVYALADRFIADANDLSGDIVLREAKRGRSASELIGLMLSRYIVRHELGPERYAGWYFLIEGEETGQVALLGVDGPLGLAGHLRPNILLGQGHQTHLRVPGPARQNVMLKIISGLQGCVCHRVSSPQRHNL